MNGVKFDSTSEVTVRSSSDSVKVRATVRATRVPPGSPRIFGLNSFPVGAKAAAVADNSWEPPSASSRSRFPDLWEDANDDANQLARDAWRELALEPGHGLYHPAHGLRVRPPRTAPEPAWAAIWRNSLCTPGSGLGIVWSSCGPRSNAGIQPAPGNLQGGKCYAPGWWGLWDATGDPGGRDQRCIPGRAAATKRSAIPRPSSQVEAGTLDAIEDPLGR